MGRKRKSQKRRLRLYKYAEFIESQNYKSDIWLKSQFSKILDSDDKFNSPEGPFIPDLINRKWKYIVECDGSIHNRPEARDRDKMKDHYFLNCGFKVFRVKCGDSVEIELIKRRILLIRGELKRIIIRNKNGGRKLPLDVHVNKTLL